MEQRLKLPLKLSAPCCLYSKLKHCIYILGSVDTRKCIIYHIKSNTFDTTTLPDYTQTRHSQTAQFLDDTESTVVSLGLTLKLCFNSDF